MDIRHPCSFYITSHSSLVSIDTMEYLNHVKVAASKTQYKK